MIRPSILRTIKLTTRPPIALGSDRRGAANSHATFDRCDSPRDSLLWSSEADDPAPPVPYDVAPQPPLPMDPFMTFSSADARDDDTGRPARPTRARFVVLGLLCLLSGILYLDRICI